METMRILQINVWGGRIKDGLVRFITEGNFDVVCMQEAIWDSKNSGVLDLLVDSIDKIKASAGFDYDIRSSHYGMKLLGGDTQYELGNAILSKIPFTESKEKIILGEYSVANSAEEAKTILGNHRYTAQKVILENGVVILNYHGYYITDPLGNETSVECMKSVADLIRDEERPVVMCGDLNVVSEAPCMRELDFLTDLTAINDVKTTLRNIRFVKDVACDHILVNDKVSYQNFKVFNAPYTDHRALYVEINA